MEVFSFCEYFGFLFVSYCVTHNGNVPIEKREIESFELAHQWTHINFTWPTREAYKNAIITKKYIPENNAVAGIKFYKNNLYLALPILRAGAPVTLGVVENAPTLTTNALVKPYPSWRLNQINNCAALQSVHSMEIDRRGIMWVLDGNRIKNFTRCPPKLVLLDLNNNGKVIQTYEFSKDLSSTQGGFLNDLVIDENDGGYAYITEASSQDSGLIVYSRLQNRAWKLRDRTMFAELPFVDFVVDGLLSDSLVPIDGIGLSPLPTRKDQERYVYYCALSSKSLFAISNRILKNEELSRGDQWRREVRFIGKKQGQTDGIVVDNEGNLYYGLLNLYAIGKWSIYEPFSTSRIIDKDQSLFIWPDSFGFDTNGYVYILANAIHKYITESYPLEVSDEIKFKVSKLFTGTKSYLYS